MTSITAYLDKGIPLTGCISYHLYSANIMQRKVFSEFFGSGDSQAANILWMNAHIGIGWYLYQTKHLQTLPVPWRLTYSVFGTAVFNFGSVLLWGTSKLILPEDTPSSVRLLLGFGSGCLLLYVGKQYLNLVDSFVI